MRRAILIAGAIGVTLLVGDVLLDSTIQAQQVNPAKKERRLIRASGTATVRVKPDAVRMTITVITSSGKLKDVHSLNAEKGKQLLDALKALKIPNLEIQTTDIRLEQERPEPREDESEKAVRNRAPQITGYRMLHSFGLTISGDDVERLRTDAARVLDVALTSGAETVEEVSFFRKDLRAARQRALTMAVEDALANARAMASGAQVSITEVVSIQDSPDHIPQADAVASESPANPAVTTLATGEIEVTCRVYVVCAY